MQKLRLFHVQLYVFYECYCVMAIFVVPVMDLCVTIIKLSSDTSHETETKY